MRKHMRDIKKKIVNFNFKKAAANFKYNAIQFVLYNRQYILFVILTLLSCIFVRTFTIKDGFNFKATFFDLSIIMLIGSLGYLFKVKNQFKYWNTCMIIITIINMINGIYFKFFNNFVTVGLLQTLGQTGEVTDAVIAKLSWNNFVYLLSPIIFLICHIRLKKRDYISLVEKIEVSKKLLTNTLIISFILLFINIATLESKDVSRLTKQWNREYIVERFGIIIYQENDIIQTVQTQLRSLFGKEEAYEKFETFYQEHPYTPSNNKYTNKYEDYNVIAIHLESIMNFLIGLKINGVEVTPNLNKIAGESLYFDNFYSQVSVGTSSDAEFTFNTSLMPVQSGTVFVSYYNRKYQTLETLLKPKGYYTFSMHGNKATMWNRSKMHPTLGYEKFYSEDSYNIDEIVGLGLSDRSFFLQSENKLEDIKKMIDTSDKYNNYMGTMIMLSNHTPWMDPIYLEGEESFDITYHTGEKDPETGEEKILDYLKDPKIETIGRFIQAAHYADKQLGQFFEYVKTSGLYNKTLFVMYGDHPAQIGWTQFSRYNNYNFVDGGFYEEGDEGYDEFDYYDNELFRKVPLIIWDPAGRVEPKRVSYPMGMIDVLPTVANMIGIKPVYALGHDIFEIKNDNIVVFPNGNFLTNKVYYRSSKGDYRLLSTDNNITLDENYIKDRVKKTEDILEVSNDIIVYDLIKEHEERSELDEKK